MQPLIERFIRKRKRTKGEEAILKLWLSGADMDLEAILADERKLESQIAHLKIHIIKGNLANGEDTVLPD